jgi:hypothetical protein
MDKTEKALKRPFDQRKLRWRKGPGGKELVYITARDVMDRLDEAVGISGWESSYREVMGRVVCELTLCIEGKYITKCDGADDTTIEGAKGALSDALKRAAVQFGVGRYLYHPAAFDDNRKPVMWATPEGYDKLMKAREAEEIKQFKKELGNV